jgi:hypothetical protein
MPYLQKQSLKILDFFYFFCEKNRSEQNGLLVSFLFSVSSDIASMYGEREEEQKCVNCGCLRAD